LNGFETAQLGIEGAARTGSTTAYHADIERLPCDALQRFCARLHPPA
jgi:hypothetical protein